VEWTPLTIYGAMALVSVLIVYLLSRRMGDVRRPPTHRLLLSLLAGAVWPLLLVGLLEVAFFAVLAKVHKSADVDAVPTR
jgi:Na+/proline symporter